MSHLGEEAEAFFMEGYAGTYDGGPRSVTPVSRDADSDEAEFDAELATELTSERLERRDRLKRLVTTIVGGCGALVVVLAPIRVLTSRHAEPALETLGPPVTFPHGGARSTPPIAPVPAPAQSPANNVAAAAEPAAAISAPTASAASLPHTVVRKHAAPARSASKAHVTSRAVPHQGAARANIPLPVNTGAHRNASVHLPPTATFPD